MCQIIVSALHLGLIVASHMAHFLLDVPDVMIVTLVNRGVRRLQLLNQFVSDVSAGNIDVMQRVGQRVTLEDGHSVAAAFATLSDQTSRDTVREK